MSWMEDAPCRKVNPAAFLSEDIREKRQAQLFCNTHCTFRERCLEFAMKMEGCIGPADRIGVYGGTLPKQRYRLYLDRKATAQRRVPTVCRSGRHSLTGDNAPQDGTGRCRACKIEYNRDYRRPA